MYDILQAKKQAALNALPTLEHASLIGMGTGSTIECLLDALSETPWGKTKRYITTSQRTENYLFHKGFSHILSIHDVDAVDVYIDGADWIDASGIAIKGYGGALFREKLVASMAHKRIALVDTSKIVHAICHQQQPLPIEVIDIARSLIARTLVAQGARVVYREGFLTDQGNPILDVYNWSWDDPLKTEYYLKSLLGVVESGLFAKHVFHTIITD